MRLLRYATAASSRATPLIKLLLLFLEPYTILATPSRPFKPLLESERYNTNSYSLWRSQDRFNNRGSVKRRIAKATPKASQLATRRE